MPEVPPAGPSCWLGPELHSTTWTRTLTSEHVAALLRLAETVDLQNPERLTVPGAADASADPAIVALATDVRSDLLDGLGFVVLTGLPVDELDWATIARVYLAFGHLIGGLRSQNADGHLLGHVRNVGADIDDPATRIYQTDRRQTFHTDSCDAVGLLCLEPAREGGESLLVSVEAAYRHMVQQRPDLAARLFEPVATDRRGEVPEGEQPWFEIPVLSWFGGRLTGLYQRQYIDSASRFDEAPRLDTGHIQALDLWDGVMNDPAVHLALAFAPGDMQFVNNHALLHDRTGFIDRPGRPRHLLRLWLTLQNGRPLPPIFTQRYGAITVGDRGGILTEGTALSIPI